ncbi:hypothetical protein TNCV_2312891 [Trichonephila clavipes]|nr:hypothetical protein TNCV_2312891 [Trichonephila clavipes]
MQTFKITRQVGYPNFACVVRSKLATMCFVSCNATNMVATMHCCKLSQKNIATIVWTGIITRKGRRCLEGVGDSLTTNGTKYSTFQKAARATGLPKSENFINEVLDDAVSFLNLTEEERQE